LSGFLEKNSSLSRGVSLISLVLFLIFNHQNDLLAQADYIAGSSSTSKANYSPGGGTNRVIVVALGVNGSAGDNWTADNLQWGGEPLNLAVEADSINNIQVWYLDEAGIAAAFPAPVDFAFSWRNNGIPAIPNSELFFALTLRNVDQTCIFSTSKFNINMAASTSIILDSLQVKSNDLVYYLGYSEATNSHTPSPGYTELIDGSTSDIGFEFTMYEAYKMISSSGFESPTATTAIAAPISITGLVFDGTPDIGGKTYYSLQSGDWEDSNIWTLSPEGNGLATCDIPNHMNDFIEILGDTITLNHTVITDPGLSGLTIKSNGRLELRTNLDLNSLNIELGSSINGDFDTLSALVFNIGTNYSIAIDGEIIGLEKIIFKTTGNLGTISGGGKIEIDNLKFQSDSLSITNDLIDSIKIADEFRINIGANASQFINNGTIITETFWIKGEKCLINNNGIFHVLNEMNLFGDSIELSNDSTFSVNILKIKGDSIRITNNSSGEFIADGDFEMFGTDLFVNNSGTFHFNSNIADSLPGGVVRFENFSNAFLNLSGEGSNPGNTQIYSNHLGNTISYNRAGNQLVFQPMDTSYYSLTLSNSGVKTLEDSIQILGDLSLQGASLDVGLGNAYPIKLFRNWINAGGSFFARLGEVEFLGIIQQSITSTSEEFYDLIINNPSGLILASPVLITNSIFYQDGILTSTFSNLLSMEEVVVVNGGSDSSHSLGPILIKDVDSKIFSFQTGDGTFLHEIELDVSNASTHDYTGEYIDGDAGALGYPTPNSPDDHVSGIGYWSLDNGGNTVTSAEVILHYISEDQVEDASDLRIYKDDGAMPTTNWVDLGGVGTGPISGTIQSNTFTDFSFFTLASNSGPGFNPLPIDQVELKLEALENGNLLTWRVPLDLEIDEFIVERSGGGLSFERIGNVDDFETKNGSEDYSFFDPEPLIGSNYYRLRYFGNGDISQYSSLVYGYFDAQDQFERIVIWPNPSFRGQVFIWIKGMKSRELIFTLFSMQGERIEQLTAIRNMNEDWKMTLPEDILPGLYFFKLKGEENISGKILIQNSSR